jgi:hypothetical protein
MRMLLALADLLLPLLWESATSQRFAERRGPWHDDERYEVISNFLGAVVNRIMDPYNKAMSDLYNCPTT